MSKVRSIYKILRSVVMTLFVSVAVLYLATYILLSIPSVQEKIKGEITRECSNLLGGELQIKILYISPFSEIVLRNVYLTSPTGDTCAGIDKVSAGIDLWQLISSRKIIINYILISGLDAEISQNSKDGPLNIQFVIDALSPKDKNKPPTRFDIKFRNVVVRDSKAKFDRKWMVDSIGRPLPFGRLELNELKMDLSIPNLSNEEFAFDIRDLRFDLNREFHLKHLEGKLKYFKGSDSNGSNTKADYLTVNDLFVDLPNSHLEMDRLHYDFKPESPIEINLNGFISPSDIRLLYSDLAAFTSRWDMMLDVSVKPTTISLRNLYLADSRDGSKLNVEAYADCIKSKDSIGVGVKRLDAVMSPILISDVLKLAKIKNDKISDIIGTTGSVALKADGSLSMLDSKADGNFELLSSLGKLQLYAKLSDIKSAETMKSAVTLNVDEMELGVILSNSKLGRTSFNSELQITGRNKNSSGTADIHIDHAIINNMLFGNIDLFAEKEDEYVDFSIDSNDQNLILKVDGHGSIGRNPYLSANAIVAKMMPGVFVGDSQLKDSEVAFSLNADIEGHNADDVTGTIDLTDLMIRKKSSTDKLYLPHLSIVADKTVEPDSKSNAIPARDIKVFSDWLEAEINGNIRFTSLISDIKSMASEVFPSLFPSFKRHYGLGMINSNDGKSIDNISRKYNDFTFTVKVPGISEPYKFFNLPFRPLSDLEIHGRVDSESGLANMDIDALHILQGTNKLIRDTKLSVDINSMTSMARMNATTIYPAKKGDVQIAIDVLGHNDMLNTRIDLNPTLRSSLKGDVGLTARFSRHQPFDSHFQIPQSNDLSVKIDIQPSEIMVSGTPWDVADGHISYSGKKIDVSNFRIDHGNQYVRIDGKVSENPDDIITVKLNEIDLDYIFGMLNINYVTFGGMASGEVVGSRLLTSTPDAHTRFLNVRDLSYNGAVLGNGNLAADYDANQKAVDIYAVIQDPLTRERRARIDGGIWVTRDSLSFSFDAEKVNLAFMKPFVNAFCSDLKGQGSGKCKLYGTFSDIDLVGSLYADTLAMKLDFTNTWYYAGGDSVKMGKGLIDVPPVTLYDKYGNSAEFSGWLRHRYFHDPVFDFKIRDAKGILCYDTNEHINPLWYGTIFGEGSGQVTGRPGLVEIYMDMTTRKGSTFTYVISDSEEFDEYSFLTFTDRRKAMKDSEKTDTIPQYLRQFVKQSQDDNSGSSEVVLNLRGSVTPDALVTIVMDPKGGDKITARGVGGLQMDYTSADNNLRMFGKYILDEGNYNFTLQDIIIKNFIIRQGSTISFNGDPMDANLDIAATYRVNTNLTDLDKSFASDKELNRTNVPVDALLMVTGPMTQPDINFDIELPTLTSDVERKVKSIVSTNDMMSRQIIYLLALNRFYTPEYTGNSSSGAEWSSMASSTISSQLSNMLSQMTDKLSVAPSFRSDKGDFTDMEFDLALSSRLLNNRLLINGNFGYRDRNTSTTQFVGDFDIEYLLNRNGNLRLKAYNHFNDQNYYLRSALTTQGVGLLYRWDFDRLLQKPSIVPPADLHKDSVMPIANDSLLILKFDSK